VANTKPPGKPRSVTTDENKEVVRNIMLENNKTSTRRLAEQTGFGLKLCWKMVHELKLKAFHPVEVQQLYAQDKLLRKAFCEKMLLDFQNDVSCTTNPNQGHS
jgi:hypothetical protein